MTGATDVTDVTVLAVEGGPTPSARAAFVSGVVKCAPIALSAIPFGAAAGMGAVEVGLSKSEASGMSVMIFAGAAQLAVLELAKSNAPWAVMVVVALTINLRFAMYSAGLSGWTTGRPLWVRVILSYLLTDQAFAVSAAESDNRKRLNTSEQTLVWFFAGAAVTLWIAWQGGTALGAAIGVKAPAELGLDLVAPLAFVALGATAIRSRADIFGAIVALLAYGGLYWLPYGLALIPAAAIGVGIRQWVLAREDARGQGARGQS